jgi:hypothetical protein
LLSDDARPCHGIRPCVAFFLKSGRIQHVVELPGLSDAEAVAKARALFEDSGNLYDGVEVWERTRRVEWIGRISREKSLREGRKLPPKP